jgi:hypothetical protein
LDNNSSAASSIVDSRIYLSINYDTKEYIDRADTNPAIKRVAINLAITAVDQNAKEKSSITQTLPRGDSCS